MTAKLPDSQPFLGPHDANDAHAMRQGIGFGCLFLKTPKNL
jgi:hypothetical protein